MDNPHKLARFARLTLASARRHRRIDPAFADMEQARADSALAQLAALPPLYYVASYRDDMGTAQARPPAPRTRIFPARADASPKALIHAAKAALEITGLILRPPTETEHGITAGNGPHYLHIRPARQPEIDALLDSEI